MVAVHDDRQKRLFAMQSILSFFCENRGGFPYEMVLEPLVCRGNKGHSSAERGFFTSGKVFSGRFVGIKEALQEKVQPEWSGFPVPSVRKGDLGRPVSSFLMSMVLRDRIDR